MSERRRLREKCTAVRILLRGAVVNLYATTSNGYGAAPALLATATTASDGSFHFASAAACPSGQQAYVTALGGDPGSGTNPNYLLMAALGDCANVSSATVIWIDEVTTIAAAFALRPFISIGGTADAPIVQIGAPATNNGSIGSCTAIAGVTAGCTAAGLSHAFANALNLANSVSVNGVNPNGTAYQVAPSNPSGSVPSALINSLANSLVCLRELPGSHDAEHSLWNAVLLYHPAGRRCAHQYPAVDDESCTVSHAEHRWYLHVGHSADDGLFADALGCTDRLFNRYRLYRTDGCGSVEPDRSCGQQSFRLRIRNGFIPACPA